MTTATTNSLPPRLNLDFLNVPPRPPIGQGSSHPCRTSSSGGNNRPATSSGAHHTHHQQQSSRLGSHSTMTNHHNHPSPRGGGGGAAISSSSNAMYSLGNMNYPIHRLGSASYQSRTLPSPPSTSPTAAKTIEGGSAASPFDHGQDGDATLALGPTVLTSCSKQKLMPQTARRPSTTSGGVSNSNDKKVKTGQIAGLFQPKSTNANGGDNDVPGEPEIEITAPIRGLKTKSSPSRSTSRRHVSPPEKGGKKDEGEHYQTPEAPKDSNSKRPATSKLGKGGVNAATPPNFRPYYSRAIEEALDDGLVPPRVEQEEVNEGGKSPDAETRTTQKQTTTTTTATGTQEEKDVDAKHHHQDFVRNLFLPKMKPTGANTNATTTTRPATGPAPRVTTRQSSGNCTTHNKIPRQPQFSAGSAATTTTTASAAGAGAGGTTKDDDPVSWTNEAVAGSSSTATSQGVPPWGQDSRQNSATRQRPTTGGLPSHIQQKMFSVASGGGNSSVTNKPKLLQALEAHLHKELGILAVTSDTPGQRLRVYREAMQLFMDNFPTYREVLCAIMAEYDRTIQDYSIATTNATKLASQLQVQNEEFDQAVAHERSELEEQHEAKTKELQELARKVKAQMDKNNYSVDTVDWMKKEIIHLREEKKDDLEKMLTLIKTIKEADNRVKTNQDRLRSMRLEIEKMRELKEMLKLSQLKIHELKDAYKDTIPRTQYMSVKADLEASVSEVKDSETRYRRLYTGRGSQLDKLARMLQQTSQERDMLKRYAVMASGQLAAAKGEPDPALNATSTLHLIKTLTRSLRHCGAPKFDSTTGTNNFSFASGGGEGESESFDENGSFTIGGTSYDIREKRVSTPRPDWVGLSNQFPDLKEQFADQVFIEDFPSEAVEKDQQQEENNASSPLKASEVDLTVNSTATPNHTPERGVNPPAGVEVDNDPTKDAERSRNVKVQLGNTSMARVAVLAEALSLAREETAKLRERVHVLCKGHGIVPPLMGVAATASADTSSHHLTRQTTTQQIGGGSTFSPNKHMLSPSALNQTSTTASSSALSGVANTAIAVNSFRRGNKRRRATYFCRGLDPTVPTYMRYVGTVESEVPRHEEVRRTIITFHKFLKDWRNAKNAGGHSPAHISMGSECSMLEHALTAFFMTSQELPEYALAIQPPSGTAASLAAASPMEFPMQWTSSLMTTASNLNTMGTSLVTSADTTTTTTATAAASGGSPATSGGGGTTTSLYDPSGAANTHNNRATAAYLATNLEYLLQRKRIGFVYAFLDQVVKWATGGGAIMSINPGPGEDQTLTGCDPLCLCFHLVLHRHVPLRLLRDAFTVVDNIREEILQYARQTFKKRVRKRDLLELLNQFVNYKSSEELQALRDSLGKETTLDVDEVTNYNHPFMSMLTDQSCKEGLDLYQELIQEFTRIGLENSAERLLMNPDPKFVNTKVVAAQDRLAAVQQLVQQQQSSNPLNSSTASGLNTSASAPTDKSTKFNFSTISGAAEPPGAVAAKGKPIHVGNLWHGISVKVHQVHSIVKKIEPKTDPAVLLAFMEVPESLLPSNTNNENEQQQQQDPSPQKSSKTTDSSTTATNKKGDDDTGADPANKDLSDVLLPLDLLLGRLAYLPIFRQSRKDGGVAVKGGDEEGMEGSVRQ